MGRKNNLEVVLRDSSGDGMHAEVKFTAGRWVLRDLTRNPLYPTLVNRAPVQTADQPLGAHDVIQLGKLMLRVASLESTDVQDPQPVTATAAPVTATTTPATDQRIRASGLHLRIQAATSRSWDEALQAVVRNPAHTTPLPGQTVAGLVQHNPQLH